MNFLFFYPFINSQLLFMKHILMLLIATLTISISQSFAQKGKVDTLKHSSYYSCPMHPEVHSIKNGVCQKCGMKLVLSTKEEMKANVTKSYSCPSHIEVTSDSAGTCPKCGKSLQLSTKEKMKMGDYYCPMHPGEVSDKAGSCPKCGMKLTKKESHDHQH